MSKITAPYKQVRPEELIADEQAKRGLSAFDKEWVAGSRHRTANTLAVGLLLLFGFTILASGTGITIIVIAGFFSPRPFSDFSAATEQLVGFISALLPFIATPLGVALGYYFRETHE